MTNSHDDVLQCAVPEPGASRQKLLEELKARARGAFQIKDLRTADQLYTRAIEINDDKDHLLYSNRAAVRLLTKKHDGAWRDADRCLNIEPTFIKAHFRKAQALQRLEKFEDAIAACNKGFEYHAGNQELTKLVQEIEKAWEEDKVNKEKLRAEAQEIRPDLPKPEPTRVPISREGWQKKEKKKVEGGEDLSMKGYKTTADGKTTSYFHTELTEEAKSLLGDCKPQKLDGDVVATTAIPGVGSAWNQAGTFEERSFTKWYKDQVWAAFPTDSLFALPDDMPNILYKATEVFGDAAITSARGKVKCIQDVGVLIKWEIGDEEAMGTIRFEHDGDDEYDAVLEVDSKSKPSARLLVNQFVKPEGRGLQGEVLKKLKEIEKKFKETKL